jgi:aryl-phospho-beta-D-glucosidase BglC (GH1 family)
MNYKNCFGVLKIAILMVVFFCILKYSLTHFNTKIAGMETVIKAAALEDGTKEEMRVEEVYINREEEFKELDTRFLKTDGEVLRNHAGTGEIVTLRGTSAGGWQLMEAWMCPTNAPDQKTAIDTLTGRFGKEKAEELFKVYESAWWQEADFDNIAELNFNVLRLPISYLNLLDEEGRLREDTLAVYDWFVQECSKREIYVILDLHAAPGSQNGRDHSGSSESILFTNSKAQELTISLWVQLAGHFQGNPTIAGYDLLNEPEGNEEERAPWGDVQLPFFDHLYRAVRSVDPDHIILFNAIWEPTDMPDPAEYEWDNVMYEYHFYGWNRIEDVTVQRRFIDSKVENNNRAGHKIPVLVGEFTMSDKLPSWEYALHVFNENGWSWTTWTYKTDDMGSWGIYNSKAAATPKVNIDTDSAEIIKEKWSKADTKTGFTRNQYLYDLLKVMADEHTGADNLRKWFHNFEFDEVTIRTDTDAKAEVVSSKETYSSWEDIGTAGTITDWAEDPPSPKSMPEKSGKADRKTLRIAVIVAGTLMACFIGYVIAVPFGKHIGKRRKEKQRNEH